MFVPNVNKEREVCLGTIQITNSSSNVEKVMLSCMCVINLKHSTEICKISFCYQLGR